MLPTSIKKNSVPIWVRDIIVGILSRISGFQTTDYFILPILNLGIQEKEEQCIYDVYTGNNVKAVHNFCIN